VKIFVNVNMHKLIS